jgi:predicted DNA-binding antitoxin AbrB/MazE fold protein
MSTTIRARFSNGHFEPLEKPSLREGQEVTLTISVSPSLEERRKALKDTAGAWADLLDCDEFIRKVYESRAVQGRPKPEL